MVHLRTCTFAELPSLALLRAIADKLIPGVPENLRILLAGQVESARRHADEKADELTVLQAVVRSDRKREVALREYRSASIPRGGC